MNGLEDRGAITAGRRKWFRQHRQLNSMNGEHVTSGRSITYGASVSKPEGRYMETEPR